jgi:carboxyl-terminal processing protease
VFYTRLGRPVRDGGGIQPDSVLAVDSVPSMVYDLTASDPFFDYATDYVTRHPAIAPAAEFSLSEDEWAKFAEAIKASDFTYNGRTATALKQLRQLARFEGYDEETKAEFDALEAKLKTNDLSADLQRFRQHIQPYLETEIVSRYYFQRGALRHTLSYDKAITRTLELIKNIQ